LAWEMGKWESLIRESVSNLKFADLICYGDVVYQERLYDTIPYFVFPGIN
jgi:hypothetical protein